MEFSKRSARNVLAKAITRKVVSLTSVVLLLLFIREIMVSTVTKKKSLISRPGFVLLQKEKKSGIGLFNVL